MFIIIPCTSFTKRSRTAYDWRSKDLNTHPSIYSCYSLCDNLLQKTFTQTKNVVHHLIVVKSILFNFDPLVVFRHCAFFNCSVDSLENSCPHHSVEVCFSVVG